MYSSNTILLHDSRTICKNAEFVASPDPFNFHLIGVGYAGVVNVRYMPMAHEPGGA